MGTKGRSLSWAGMVYEGRPLLGVAWRARVELSNLHVYFGADYRGQRIFSLDFICGETKQREGVASMGGNIEAL